MSVRAALADVFGEPRRTALTAAIVGPLSFIPYLGPIAGLGYAATFAGRVASEDGLVDLPDFADASEVLHAGIVGAGACLAPALVMWLPFVAFYTALGAVLSTLSPGEPSALEQLAFGALLLLPQVCLALAAGIAAAGYIRDGARGAFEYGRTLAGVRRHLRAFATWASALGILAVARIAVLDALSRTSQLPIRDPLMSLSAVGFSGPVMIGIAANMLVLAAFMPLEFVAAHLLGQYARLAYGPENGPATEPSEAEDEAVDG